MSGKNSFESNLPSKDDILVAYEKLFTDGQRGVSQFQPSGLRYLKLSEGVLLVEQNPDKQSRWAKLARAGHHVAWVMRDGKYIVRIIDGEIESLDSW